MAAAWTPELIAWEALILRGRLAAVAEHVWLHRTDLPGARVHPYWDAGLAAGAELSVAIGGPLWLGGRAGVSWFPTARPIEIPGARA